MLLISHIILKIFQIVLSKYYFSTLFGSVLILVNIASVTPDSDVWISKGNFLSDLNKSDEAITAYDKAIELNP